MHQQNNYKIKTKKLCYHTDMESTIRVKQSGFFSGDFSILCHSEVLG